MHRLIFTLIFYTSISKLNRYRIQNYRFYCVCLQMMYRNEKKIIGSFYIQINSILYEYMIYSFQRHLIFCVYIMKKIITWLLFLRWWKKNRYNIPQYVILDKTVSLGMMFENVYSWIYIFISKIPKSNTFTSSLLLSN